MIRTILVTASAALFCLLVAGCDSGSSETSVPGRDKERERPADPQKAPGVDISAESQDPARVRPPAGGGGAAGDGG